MNLVYKLKNDKCFEETDKNEQKERNKLFRKNLEEGLGLIIGKDSNILEDNITNLLSSSLKTRFSFLSNTLELLFRCLLYFLNYRQ